MLVPVHCGVVPATNVPRVISIWQVRGTQVGVGQGGHHMGRALFLHKTYMGKYNYRGRCGAGGTPHGRDSFPA